jgi:hypothetical protein
MICFGMLVSKIRYQLRKILITFTLKMLIVSQLQFLFTYYIRNSLSLTWSALFYHNKTSEKKLYFLVNIKIILLKDLKEKNVQRGQDKFNGQTEMRNLFHVNFSFY